MDSWLRELAVQVEDLCSIPDTHMEVHNLVCKSRPMENDVLFLSPWVPGTHVHNIHAGKIPTHKHTNITHTYNLFKNSNDWA